MNHQLPLTILFCLLMAGGIAHGQPAASQTECGSNPACFALYEQGQQQATAGQLAEALRSYKLAYEVQADPRLAYSIARLMHLQGQEAEAVPYYRRFLESKSDDDAQNSQFKAKAQEYLAQCELIAAAALAKKQEEERKRLEDERRKQEEERKRADLLLQTTPIYKKGWFWAIIGGSAAVIGLGVGLGVGLSNRGPSLPDGVNTYTATF